MIDPHPPFWQFLDKWLATRIWPQNRLADELHVHQTVVSKWLHSNPRRRTRPGRRVAPELAKVLGISLSDLMAMILSDEAATDRFREQARTARSAAVGNDAAPQAPISTRIRSLDDQLQRWLAVMGPGLGQEEAERLFWDARVRDARRQVDDVEAALTANQRTITSPIEEVTRQRGSDDGALTETYRPRVAMRVPLAA